jgi:hypothetical protein
MMPKADDANYITYITIYHHTFHCAYQELQPEVHNFKHMRE